MINPSWISRARHSDAAKQAHRLVRREGDGGRKSCLPPTEYERAQAAAAERSFLRAILEKGLEGRVGNDDVNEGSRGWLLTDGRSRMKMIRLSPID